MKVTSLRLRGIRCFEDTGEIELSPTCNVFVGENNAGKSTLLRGLLAFQAPQLGGQDFRFDSASSSIEIGLDCVPSHRPWSHNVSIVDGSLAQVLIVLRGQPPSYSKHYATQINNNVNLFPSTRPSHYMIPYQARRKAVLFNQEVNANTWLPIDETLSNLYTKIDKIVSGSTARANSFHKVVEKIIGVQITMQMSQGGKIAGFEFDENRPELFVEIERMGDGVSEVVSLVADLCTERDKLFVIEEPETNLHPGALKALMALIRENWFQNQFVIATHSNIVVRELGDDTQTRIFRVARSNRDPRAPSIVQPVPAEPSERMLLLQELGYEFVDMDLHEGWLFLEESSAEQVIRDVLIPVFDPRLRGRLRTFSAAGVDNLEPSVTQFQRLVTFVHLQPVYQGKIWVRADGDERGHAVVATLKSKFDYLDETHCGCFNMPAFERYYPAQFRDRVETVLAISDKLSRRTAKADLLREVISWTGDGSNEVKASWAESAKEVIELLRSILPDIVTP